jgi:hypothetical protein
MTCHSSHAVYRVLTVFRTLKGVHKLFKLCDLPGFGYFFVIVPQAIRSPAFPAGSVFMSSALA